jgi:hypothetical protein
MVRNTHGGNRAKGFARKNYTKGASSLRVSHDEAEVYAQVSKVLGGTMCHVTDLEGTQMLCHIRGKFRGRGKRDNFIGPGTWLLVGLHTWETVKSGDDKIINCDILEVYNDSDKSKLKNSITSINWSKFIHNDTKTIGDTENESNEHSNFVFVDDAAQEYEELIAAQASTGTKNSLIIDNNEEIDIDDI